MKRYHILDLDNTIADDGWRIPRINWNEEDPTKRYHVYHLLSGFDRTGNLSLVCPQGNNIIFTARPVAYREITEEWLRRHNIKFKFLLMRNNGDHRHSLALKREMLAWLPLHYDVGFEEVKFAADDREDVVAMFLEHGIAAFWAPIHSVCAYTNPNKKETKQ